MDQGYTGEQTAEDAQAHGIALEVVTDAASKWADQVLRKPSYAALHLRSRCLYLDAASVTTC